MIWRYCSILCIDPLATLSDIGQTVQDADMPQHKSAALDLHPYDTILYVPSHGGQNTELVPVHSRG